LQQKPQKLMSAGGGSIGDRCAIFRQVRSNDATGVILIAEIVTPTPISSSYFKWRCPGERETMALYAHFKLLNKVVIAATKGHS